MLIQTHPSTHRNSHTCIVIKPASPEAVISAEKEKEGSLSGEGIVKDFSFRGWWA